MPLNQVICGVLAINFLLGSAFGVVVHTNDGPIEGTTMTSRLGANFNAFVKIPFAAPPINNLRFRAPQAVAPWTNTLNCTSYGPMCVQRNARPGYEISEDCLHLNVFTKGFTELKPVIVFFHGGGFSFGTARDQGGPQNLMDREIVLVTVNYRLGALGFLATGTEESPGNAGLKDQVMALRWVQNNIDRFGGDRARVTIAGISAGSFSVVAHMISPMSTGLFDKAIAMSGAMLNQLFRTEYAENADIIAEALGCARDSVAEMITCLRTVRNLIKLRKYLIDETSNPQRDPLEIIIAELTNLPQCQGWSWPVVEPDFGQERFLVEEPAESFKRGNFSKVPIIVGRTADENVDAAPSKSIL